MADTVSRKKRSEIMRAVKSENSQIEVKFRKILSKAGLRYRKNPPGYFGKPDILLKKRKIVIFVDSCFWHGCKKHCRIPKTRKKYWILKIERNKERDKEVNKYYKRADWKVLRIWEHELKINPKKA